MIDGHFPFAPLAGICADDGACLDLLKSSNEPKQRTARLSSLICAREIRILRHRWLLAALSLNAGWIFWSWVYRFQIPWRMD